MSGTIGETRVKTLEEFALQTVFGHTEVANDNRKTYRYAGICRVYRKEQESQDPDIQCIRCGNAVNYVDREPPDT